MSNLEFLAGGLLAVAVIGLTIVALAIVAGDDDDYGA